MSTLISSLVEPVWKVAPQEQVIVIWLYLGWMLAFIREDFITSWSFCASFTSVDAPGDDENGEEGEE